MSMWTGSSRGRDPEAITDIKCPWQFCTMRVPVRFHEAGMLLCREHALLAWTIVNEQMGMVQQAPLPDPPPPPAKTVGIVYFIRTAGRIKIGHSIDVERRLAQYPPDVEVLYLVSGDKQRERREHMRFRAYLADGREWFQDREEVTAAIEDMAAGDSGWRGRIDDDSWWRRRRRAEPEVVTGRNLKC